jgi:hypothetical protein
VGVTVKQDGVGRLVSLISQIHPSRLIELKNDPNVSSCAMYVCKAAYFIETATSSVDSSD